MKNEEQFIALKTAFYEAVNGKSGDEFVNAVNDFAITNFEVPTVRLLYHSDKAQVLFVTDHPLNDVGFIFHEVFGKWSAFTVESKTKYIDDIAELALKASRNYKKQKGGYKKRRK